MSGFVASPNEASVRLRCSSAKRRQWFKFHVDEIESDLIQKTPSGAILRIGRSSLLYGFSPFCIGHEENGQGFPNPEKPLVQYSQRA